MDVYKRKINKVLAFKIWCDYFPVWFTESDLTYRIYDEYIELDDGYNTSRFIKGDYIVCDERGIYGIENKRFKEIFERI